MPPDKVDRLIAGIKARRKEAAAYRANPSKVRDELLPLAEEMKKHSSLGNVTEFREYRDKLGSRIQWFEQNQVPIGLDIGNPLAEDIIEAFKGHDPALDHLAIRVAGKYSNSAKTKEYLLSRIKEGGRPEQDSVLHTLAWSKLWAQDPDFFSALEDLLSRRGGEDAFVLSDLLVIDRERALPILMKIVDTTKSGVVFYQVSSMVASFKRTDLLERLFRRVREIPLEDRSSVPGLCNVPPEALLDYIRAAEGEKLAFALDAFAETHAAGRDGYPLLVAKLSSANVVSRRAIVHCISTLVRRGSWTNRQVLSDLKDHVTREADEDAQKEAQETIGYLEFQLRGR